jgi:hypothetical protein
MKLLRGSLLLRVAAALTISMAACDRHPHDPGTTHSLGRVEIIDRSQDERPVVASWTAAGGWQGTLPDISLATTPGRISLDARIHDANNQERELSADGEYSVQWTLAPNAPLGVVVNDDSRGNRYHGDHVHVYGQAPGTTRIQFVLWHMDHSDGATPPIDIRVIN